MEMPKLKDKNESHAYLELPGHRDEEHIGLPPVHIQPTGVPLLQHLVVAVVVVIRRNRSPQVSRQFALGEAELRECALHAVGAAPLGIAGVTHATRYIADLENAVGRMI